MNLVSRIILTIVCACVTAFAPAACADERPIFESDIQPILAKKCGKCHSAKVHKGGLDLSTMRGLRRGGESEESVVMDKLDNSLLWTMIDDDLMPPEGQTPLTKQEVALIRKWVAAGSPSKTAVESTEKKLTQHDILPIVLLRCTTCHGRQRQAGNLDLRTPTAMRKGGKHGPAFVPGDPDASRMIQRVESEACPPRGQLLKFFVRRPPQSEVAVLRKWIAAGTPEVDVPPDVATTEPDRLVTDDDRQHWAFQPPSTVTEAESIDEFISEKLKEIGLTLSPVANRDTLIRRAYLDLVGMPPSPTEWKQWRESRETDWYRTMIDHLLASPHYGERWGRYWLDIAGYADSEGGVSADPVRRVAWKYRDYVVRSFNDDKPYNRFLLEQIAGDELRNYERASPVTDEMVENLIATGFLRMGIDETGSRTMNFVPERIGVIGDVIKVIGSGVMGLTMECARCHSHKYDPLPHRDYYRFKAIFQGALDEHDWLTFKNRTLSVATTVQRKRVSSSNPPLLKKLKTLSARKKKAVAVLQIETLRQHYPDQSESDRTATLRALKIADNNRSQPQRLLVEKLQRAELVPDHEQPRSVVESRRAVQTIEQAILQVQRQLEPPLAIRALWDRGEPSPTYILRRGDHDKPGRLVGPGVPSVLTNGRTPFAVESPFPGKTGRRLAFARWLTKPDHPLTSRVMVNNLWYHHFGTGLVKTLDNLGVKGERPSHPELLDWLAVQFTDRDWSIKEMHRLMMNSRTYRQSSRVTEQRRKLDPQNRLLSRMSLRRMDAEALRDSLLFVSGKLTDTPGGPPDAVTVDRDGMVTANATADGGWRRSLYLQYRRTEIPTMLDTFDYPEMGPNCVTRSVSIVSPQSLLLLNNQRVRELAVAFATRVEGLTEDRKTNDDGTRVELVYQIALNRPPSDDERRLGIAALEKLTTSWNGDRRAAFATYCHTILNSAAFLYVD